jgi:hypothetical protein
VRRSALQIELIEHRRIVVRRDHDEHVLEVLRGSAHEAWPADVDLLDQRVEWRIGARRRLGERIEIDGHEIDHRDPVLRRRLAIGRHRAARENAAVDHRMQRLDTAVHHFRKAGDRADRKDGKTAFLERARRPAGRYQLESARRQATRKIEQSIFVRDA